MALTSYRQSTSRNLEALLAVYIEFFIALALSYATFYLLQDLHTEHFINAWVTGGLSVALLAALIVFQKKIPANFLLLLALSIALGLMGVSIHHLYHNEGVTYDAWLKLVVVAIMIMLSLLTYWLDIRPPQIRPFMFMLGLCLMALLAASALRIGFVHIPLILNFLLFIAAVHVYSSGKILFELDRRGLALPAAYMLICGLLAASVLPW